MKSKAMVYIAMLRSMLEKLPSDQLKEELKQWVSEKKLALLQLQILYIFLLGLPKTRSGKIMRRILRKIAANEHNQLGDTSTLSRSKLYCKNI